MPWSPAQHRLFEAAAHNPQIAQQRGIPLGQAQQMAGEGIKQPSMPAQPQMGRPSKGQMLARVLSTMKGPRA